MIGAFLLVVIVRHYFVIVFIIFIIIETMADIFSTHYSSLTSSCRG